MKKPVLDSDNPPLTREQVLAMRPMSDVDPELASELRRRQRGKQKAPTKRLISLRVDQSVLDAYKASGKGWQSRINEMLAKHAPRRSGKKAAVSPPSPRPSARAR